MAYEGNLYEIFDNFTAVFNDIKMISVRSNDYDTIRV